jgi:hypothetical protein
MSGHRLLSVGPRASHASHGGWEIMHHEERQRLAVEWAAAVLVVFVCDPEACQSFILLSMYHALSSQLKGFPTITGSAS